MAVLLRHETRAENVPCSGLGPDARRSPRKGGGTGASLLIYLLPWHSPWVGAPPRAGTDGVPGSQQCLSSLGHPPGKTAFVTNPRSHKGRDLEKLRPSRVMGAEGAWLQVLCLCAQTLFLTHWPSCLQFTSGPFPVPPAASSPGGLPWIRPLFSRCSLSPFPVGSCYPLTLIKDCRLGLSQLRSTHNPSLTSKDGHHRLCLLGEPALVWVYPVAGMKPSSSPVSRDEISRWI